MDNIWHGRSFRASYPGPQSLLVRRLRRFVVDDVEDFFSGSRFGERNCTHLLAGVVYTEKVRLRIPDRDRAPLWPLSPVFLGRVTAGDDGSSELVGRVRVRRRTIVVSMIAIIVLAATLPFAMGTGWAVVVVGGLLGFFTLQVVFVLPVTRRRMESRITAALTGTYDGTSDA